MMMPQCGWMGERQSERERERKKEIEQERERERSYIRMTRLNRKNSISYFLFNPRMKTGKIKWNYLLNRNHFVRFFNSNQTLS
jgi:hypothetical protein